MASGGLGDVTILQVTERETGTFRGLDSCDNLLAGHDISKGDSHKLGFVPEWGPDAFKRLDSCDIATPKVDHDVSEGNSHELGLEWEGLDFDDTVLSQCSDLKQEKFKSNFQHTDDSQFDETGNSCNKRNKKVKNLKQHIDAKDVTCQICFKKVKILHMKDHCDLCEYKATHKSHLGKHVNTLFTISYGGGYRTGRSETPVLPS